MSNSKVRKQLEAIEAKTKKYSQYAKIEYEQLFTKDLQKIYDDLLFFLWWEKNVRLQRVEKEYNECRKYVDIYDKIEISNEDMRKLENR